MSRPKPLYHSAETIKRYRLPLDMGVLRIWRDTGDKIQIPWEFPESEAHDEDDDVLRVLARYAPDYNKNWQAEMLEDLCGLPGITAIEYTNDRGRGVVIYVEWP